MFSNPLLTRIQNLPYPTQQTTGKCLFRLGAEKAVKGRKEALLLERGAAKAFCRI